MKWFRLIPILVIPLVLFSCANVNEEADKTFIDTSKLPLMFYSVDKDAERMLYEAMYTSPVKWNPYDLEKVLTARGTLKMADDYLTQREKTQGGITYHTLREFLNFTTYAFEQYEIGADGRAEQIGQVTDIGDNTKTVDVLTEQEKWIYYRVKSDVWTNLKSLRAYVDAVGEDINTVVDDITIDRFKKAFAIVENVIPVKLPTGIDF